MAVMIVDDSLTVRMDLDEAFRDAGYRTTLCSTVEEARLEVGRTPPELIVLDVVLPGDDGVSLLRELRSDDRTREIPVILLSSADEVKDRVRGLSEGAHEFMGKPYDVAAVIHRARGLLRRGAPKDSAELPPRLLIVDDSLTFRHELADFLDDAGYLTAQASSAEEGLRVAADLHPAGIIVDGIMPDMGGADFIRRMRLDAGLSRTPCLLLTAAEEIASEVAALESGADAYARKGDGLDVLLVRLKAMLRASGPQQTRTTSLLSPKRILAVDDSLTFLGLIAHELRREGYEVVRARSGEEALSLLEVEQVDAILLDLLMPEMSGTDTCQLIKASPRLRDIPVIILTASEGRDSLIEGINAGADDYVGKSASLEVIKARLRAQLRRKQFEDENRKIRDDLQKKETEARVAREVAAARQELLDELSEKNAKLAFHVDELRRLNGELETFAYSVSHDLRQPLRGMRGFSQILAEKYGPALDEQGQHYLGRISAAAERMERRVDGLLALSQVSRVSLSPRPVPVGKLVARILTGLQETEPDRPAAFEVDEQLMANVDLNLIESALENLLRNAWKFSRERPLTRIAFGVEADGSESCFIRDNGVGFDMEYADAIFGPFQRLHSAERFEGTGIGLATVQRVIHRHGGRIWVESEKDVGTTFHFSVAGGFRHLDEKGLEPPEVGRRSL